MSVLHQAPRFDPPGAVAIARDVYGLEATATPLPSERDQNFRLDTAGGTQFVLKIANGAEDRAILEAQNAAMAHLAGCTSLCPRVVPTPSGQAIVEQDSPGGRHFIRLLSWIHGRPLGMVRRQSPDLLEDLGRRLGEVDRALATFDHPSIHREFHWDLDAGFRTVQEYVHCISNPSLRTTIDAISREVLTETGPLLSGLRRSAIHNDANDHNIIVADTGAGTRGTRVAGLIDFGDIVHSITAADLAIALAYVVLDKPDPLSAAARVVGGYHKAYPLRDDEFAALFGLLRLRLCMSVALAAYQQPQRPDDEYLAISQASIARTLPRLNQVPPRFAEATFRHACGLEPVPASSRIAAWLGVSPAWSPVMDVDPARTVVLDLSISSPLVSADPVENAEPALTARIQTTMAEAGATVGIGRYLEPRLLYATPLFAPDEGSERRMIHLGVDLFARAGTPVHAPLPGVVHLAGDNDAPLDYGPVVILKHETADGEVFYTLYGHVSRESLADARIGRAVGAGEAFAAIGEAGVNGGWTPHLHVQLITDLLGMGRDFPGVCRASEREVWQAISPDPSLVLRLAGATFPAAALSSTHLREERRQRIGRNLSVAYRDPVTIVRGSMQYLFDVNGVRYIDAYNNVPHVGHCHPVIVRAVAGQMRVLNTNTRYLHDGLQRYAERLAATLPDPLRVCYFVNSGSEANELALRLARAHTDRRDIIVLESGYHGNTTTLIDISPYKFNGPSGQGAPPWVHVVPVPDVYRGAYNAEDPRASAKYSDEVAVTIAALEAGRPGSRLCAFLAETCPSVAGQIVLPPGYLQQVYQHVRAGGGVCIADEVQTAYGRMGTHFYAFEAHGVVPDIVVLGKPIGNGYPLGAIVTTPEIAASFDNGMEFFSTFGGSTVSCAAGLAVLELVQEEDRQAHALRVGQHLLQGLRLLGDRYAIIGDVRGSGLFLGVDLVTDRETRKPATDAASFIVNRMREERILLGSDGPNHNVLKIRPPMPFDEADADRLLETLERVLWESFG